MNDDDEIALLWARTILAAAVFVIVLVAIGMVATAAIDTAIYMLGVE